MEAFSYFSLKGQHQYISDKNPIIKILDIYTPGTISHIPCCLYPVFQCFAMLFTTTCVTNVIVLFITFGFVIVAAVFSLSLLVCSYFFIAIVSCKSVPSYV